jgi:hypothetical protein
MSPAIHRRRIPAMVLRRWALPLPSAAAIGAMLVAWAATGREGALFVPGLLAAVGSYAVLSRMPAALAREPELVNYGPPWILAQFGIFVVGLLAAGLLADLLGVPSATFSVVVASAVTVPVSRWLGMPLLSGGAR